VRLQRTAGVIILAITLSAVAHAQQAVPIRDDVGRWVMANRPLNPVDVPTSSPLYGITVVDGVEGKSAVVTATSAGSLLRVGDRVDEIQLPGLKDRERNANPGYFRYQVWTASDFYHLASKCLDACLVRLRGVENTMFEGTHTVSGPRVFGYVPVGTGNGFGVELNEQSGAVAKYVDLRTGERFGPPASAAFGR